AANPSVVGVDETDDLCLLALRRHHNPKVVEIVRVEAPKTLYDAFRPLTQLSLEGWRLVEVLEVPDFNVIDRPKYGVVGADHARDVGMREDAKMGFQTVQNEIADFAEFAASIAF